MKRLVVLLSLGLSSNLLPCPPSSFTVLSSGSKPSIASRMFGRSYLIQPQVGQTYVHELREIDPSSDPGSAGRILHKRRTATRYEKIRNIEGQKNAIAQQVTMESFDPQTNYAPHVRTTYFTTDFASYFDAAENTWADNVESKVKEPIYNESYLVETGTQKHYYSWELVPTIEIGDRQYQNVMVLNIAEGHRDYPASLLQNYYASGQGFIGYRHQIYRTHTPSVVEIERITESHLIEVTRDQNPF